MALAFVLCFLVSALLSLIMTPVATRLAFAIGAVDKPDERKIHKRVMPRLGGIAAFFSFAVTLVILHFVFPHLRLEDIVAKGNWEMVAASFLIILTLGVCDDVWSLAVGQKFLVQLLAGSLVYVAGFRIVQITNPFGGGLLELGLFSYPLTVLWVVGITNAFNLIDGLDGLASGVALIAGLAITAISIFHSDVETAAVALAFVGAVFGFLRYNFNPARVFLGDSGSLFLGFTLAVLSIESSTKGSTAFSIVVPILVLGVPIMDTMLAMLRRVLGSFLPDQNSSSAHKGLRSMFLPDKRHIHHQLIASGLSHRDAVIVLYIVACAFGLSAFLVTAWSLNTSLLLVAIGLVIEFGVRKLGYREMAFIRNGLLLRFYRRTFLSSLARQVILDTLSVLAAFVIAYLITVPSHVSASLWRSWAFAAVVVSIIQLFAFIVGGLYKRSVSLFGLGDLLQILKSTVAGVVVTAIAFAVLPVFPRGGQIVEFIIMDFYFLTTMVVGSRVIFHALNYVFHRESGDGKRSIIYGADHDGLMALQSLISSESSRRISPIGFLDDDPKLEGKFLDGYPIYGGHWKLEGLIRQKNLVEVVIASRKMNTLVLDRIRKTADEYDIPVRLSQMKFELVGLSRGEVSPSDFYPQRQSAESEPEIAYYGVPEEME